MVELTNKQYKTIISGANLLGTGGGGTIADASPLLKEIKGTVRLATLQELSSDALVVTTFAVGGRQYCNPVLATRNALQLFQKLYRKKISAIIPVEVGSESIAIALFTANLLDVPIIDSDIVGMRSSPEVFLETITLAQLLRTPCAIADDKENSAILWNTTSLMQMEKFFRDFAVSVGGDAFIVGYPLTIAQLRSIGVSGSITNAQQIGIALNRFLKKEDSLKSFCAENSFTLFTTGIIKSVETVEEKGFVTGSYSIVSESDIWNVFYKNENIVLRKNNNTILTCPDSICLLDTITGEGINNFKNNKDRKVAILGRKALPIWRTEDGKKLFNPQKLGYKFKQKLLD